MMATVRVDVAPKMLEWAVRRVGWDEDTASQKFPSLDAWLHGEKKPTLKQLQAFSKKTHAPFGQLFLDEPPVEEVPIPDMRTIGNQRLAEPSPDLLDTIYLCQLRQDWYRDYGEEVGLEELPFVGAATTKSSVVDTAEAIRKELSFGVQQRNKFSTWEDALRYLLDAIEGLGVLVMVNGVVGADTSRTLDPDEFRGFALADSIAPLIFINGADTKAAHIFTLIHELAHLWLGSSVLSDATMARKAHQPMEQWCNQVAAEVLVPIKDLR
ncbi:ImmA/IrrE family metallo-endopeptidase, partial [Corynebacterium falsenii]